MKVNAHKIKLILAEMDMTRTDLAAKCGISRQNISTILTRGTCAPKTAGRLAKGLGVPLTEIVEED